MIKKIIKKKEREQKFKKFKKKDIFICGPSIEYSIFTKGLTQIIYYTGPIKDK